MKMLHLKPSDLPMASRFQLECEIFGQDEIYSIFDEDKLTAGQYTTGEYRAKLAQWTEED
jgi:hypothetical protein